MSLRDNRSSRSSSSSRSRSLSPYNKRRKARSEDRGRRSRDASPKQTSRSTRRSPHKKRSRSPHRRSSRSPQRRRNSPRRSTEKRRSSPRYNSNRRRSSPQQSSRHRSPSPAAMKRVSPLRSRTPLSSPRRGVAPRYRSRSRERSRRRSASPRGRANRSRDSPQRRRSPPRKSANYLRRDVSPKERAFERRSPPRRQESHRRHESPPIRRENERSQNNYQQQRDLRRNSPDRRRERRDRSHTPPPSRPHPHHHPVAPHSRHEVSSSEQYSAAHAAAAAPAANVIPLDPLQGNHDMDYRKGAGRGARESGAPVSSSNGATLPQPKRELGFTAVTTDQRFSPFCDAKHFTPKDVISIGIERSILGDEPAVIPPHLRTDHVVLKRRKQEGVKPLSLRQEFVMRDEDVEEKRVIKVLRTSTSPEPRSRKKSEPENFKVRRDASLSDRWARASTRDADTHNSSSHSLKHGDRDERLVTSRRMEKSGDRAKDRSTERRKERAASPVVTMTIRDRDERIVSSRESRPSRDYSGRGDDVHERGGDLPRDPNDLRYNLSRKRGEVQDARERIKSRRYDDTRRRSEGEEDSRRVRRASQSPDTLPDFSKRPDRFQYKEWEGNPEMIPRNSMYFEHDNRDDPEYRPRGRGRGFYRGSSRGFGYTRGRGRWNRGRGYVSSSSSSYERPWEHDKYQDEEPSSTTK